MKKIENEINAKTKSVMPGNFSYIKTSNTTDARMRPSYLIKTSFARFL